MHLNSPTVKYAFTRLKFAKYALSVIAHVNAFKTEKMCTYTFKIFKCAYYMKVRPHYAARQNATHCSFATRQKLLGICRQCNRVHIFVDLFQVTKTVERDRRTWCDFFFKLADTVLKPLIHQMPRGFF